MLALPTRVHPAHAVAAVDAFLGDVQWQKRGNELGWRIVQHGPLTVLVTLSSLLVEGDSAASLAGAAAAETAETYVLRLECAYYPSAPPDAQFVNPATERYDPATDRQFLPRLQAPYCWVHPIYPYQSTYPYGQQLVCSSMTLGYYFSGHNPLEHQRWDPLHHTIGSTLWTIHKALHSSYYLGREPAHDA